MDYSFVRFFAYGTASQLTASKPQHRLIHTLALLQSICACQFGEPGLFAAPKLTASYHIPSMSTYEQPARPSGAEPDTVPAWSKALLALDPPRRLRRCANEPGTVLHGPRWLSPLDARHVAVHAGCRGAAAHGCPSAKPSVRKGQESC